MALNAVVEEPIVFTPASEIAGGLTVAVYQSLAAVEAIWRELETRVVMTPYQRFDWIDAYCAAGFKVPNEIAILVMSSNGRPIALLPFGVSRRFGVRQAQIIGMPISNSDSLIYDPAYASKLTPEAIRAAFVSLEEAGVKVDLVTFHCLIKDWQGHSNPLLAFPHAPAPNNLYLGSFPTSDGPFLSNVLPHKRRDNIRRSQKKLAEAYGSLIVREAKSVADIENMHAAFIEQRGERFRQMGVENVFAHSTFQTLFRSLAISSLGQKTPAFRYHALCAGDEIIATSLGISTSSHYSQYISSTSTGPASKHSLMGVMLSLLLDQLRNEGIRTFDMGLGDFGYKTAWTQATTVYDSVIPVSALGSLAAPALLGARNAKRIIKQTPALWNAARSLLALKTRLRAVGKQ